MHKKGFTIVEVSILFVIFLIVAFLAAPLSLDDTAQAKNTSRWRHVQEDFSNILYAINTYEDASEIPFVKSFESVIKNEIKEIYKPYRVSYMDGSLPKEDYQFSTYNVTYSNAVVAYKFFEQPVENRLGILMYDVNGNKGPNVWGKDVFGYDIYEDKFEPFCKNDAVNIQKKDCSKRGSGLCCSNYYLVGGSFDQ